MRGERRARSGHRCWTHDSGKARNITCPSKYVTDRLNGTGRSSFNGNMHVLQFWRAWTVKLDKDAKCLWADHYLESLSAASGHFRPMWEGLFFFINDLSRPCKHYMAERAAVARHGGQTRHYRTHKSSPLSVMCYCSRLPGQFACRCRLLI